MERIRLHDMTPRQRSGLHADGSHSETRVRCVPTMLRLRLLFQYQDLDVLVVGVWILEHSSVELSFGVPEQFHVVELRIGR
jgi:hypothetical protein